MLNFEKIYAIALPVLTLAFAWTLCPAALDAQQLSDGTIYAGEPGGAGYNGDGGKATDAELFSPVGVAIDSKGNLYIADSLNNRIRRVAADTGIITTFAGTGQVGIPTRGDIDDGAPATKADIIQPSNVAVDGADNVYIFSFPNATRISKVTASTGIISTVVPNSVLANFSSVGAAEPGSVSMAVDKTGSTIWLAGSGQVLKIDVASEKVTTFPTGSPFAETLALAPNGDLIFVEVIPPGTVFPSIVRMNAETGAITTVFNSTLPNYSGFLLPIALCTDSSGNIFFSNMPGSNQSPNAIFRIEAGTDAISQVAATASQFIGPVTNSLVADEAGNLYFSEIDDTVHQLVLALAQPAPAINANGVVNAATNKGPVAAGSIAAVFGTFPIPKPVSSTSFPIPTDFSGLSLDFGSTPPAPLFFGSSLQINAQVPWELAGEQQTTVSAMLNGQSSTPQTLTIAAYAPGIFVVNSQTNQGAILDANYQLISPSNPAAVDSTVQIFCTGLGPVTNQPSSGEPALSKPLSETTAAPIVMIGGTPAKVLFSGLTPGDVGLYQINVQVPAASSGSAVPVIVSIGGAKSNTVNTSIR